MIHRAAAEEVAARLATTALAGAAVTEVALPDGAGTTCVVDLPAGDLMSLWAEARDVLAGLALHPVAVTTWGERDWRAADLFSRFFYGGDAAPEAVIARARTLSVQEALGHFARNRDWAAQHWDDALRWHLASTTREYGSAPEAAAVADVAPGDEVALERILMDWEEAIRPTTAPVLDEAFGWFEPLDRTGLALLPLAEPGHAAAYLSFHGAQGPGGHEALVRLMCSWQQRFGAQLVANWGTMLLIVATTPPATLDEAFMLAAEHKRVAPSTTALAGTGARHLARHLWRAERWFLHERP